MLKKLLKNSFFYSISTFLSKGIGVILLPFYTRVLTPSDYGIMDLVAVSVLMVTNAFSLQTNQSMCRYYVDDKSVEDQKSYFSTTMIFYIIIYSVIAFIVYTFRSSFALFLFGSASYSSVLTLAALNILINNVYYLTSTLYRLKSESKQFSLLSFIRTIASSLLIILFVLFLKMGVIGVFWGQIAANTLMLLIVLGKLIGNFDIKLFSRTKLFEMIRFGFPLVPTVLIIFIMQYVDRIMITKMIGIEALGLYAVGIKVSSLISLLLSGFQLAWGPYVFGNYQKEDTKRIISIFFHYINIFSLLIVSFLLLFSSDLLKILADPSFYNAYKVVPLLSVSTLFFALGSYFSIGFGIANKNGIQSIIYLFVIIINISLNYMLIKKNGITGAALATMISFILSGISSIIISNRFYPIEYNLKKLALYLIYFALNVTIYVLFLNNELTLKELAIKFSLMFIWVLLIFRIEKIDPKKLKNKLDKSLGKM